MWYQSFLPLVFSLFVFLHFLISSVNCSIVFFSSSIISEKRRTFTEISYCSTNGYVRTQVRTYVRTIIEFLLIKFLNFRFHDFTSQLLRYLDILIMLNYCFILIIPYMNNLTYNLFQR